MTKHEYLWTTIYEKLQCKPLLREYCLWADLQAHRGVSRIVRNLRRVIRDNREYEGTGIFFPKGYVLHNGKPGFTEGEVSSSLSFAAKKHFDGSLIYAGRDEFYVEFPNGQVFKVEVTESSREVVRGS